MLNELNSFTSFSVKDIEEANTFYAETLGLKKSEQPGPPRFSSKGCDFMIYPKPDHVPADFTILNFVVENLESKIDELTAKGVSFLQYDLEDMKTDEKGIYRGDHGEIAWMKDPSGNILGLINGN